MRNEQVKNRKPLYILLALSLAAIIWIYVDEFGYNGGARAVQKVIEDIPIIYTNEDDLVDQGLMLIEDQTSASMTLTVEGGRRTIAWLDKDDVTATVSLSGITKPGFQVVRCQVNFSDKRFSEDMITEYSIDDRNTAFATINVKELTSKVVEIRCELIGEVADGYFAGQMELEQDTLEIRGQSADLDAVSYAKVVLDIGDGAMETVSEDLEFQYYNENGQLLDASNIRPEVDTVRTTLPVYVTKELTLVVNFKEAEGARVSNLNYNITPPTIVVSGEASTLNDINSIVLGELDLLELLGSDTSTHTYPIILPDGCQNLSGVTRATMDASFKDMKHTSIHATSFTYTNLPDGKYVDILTSELMVRIFGTSQDVAAVTSENLSVIADLGNYSYASGTYTVPATIQVASGGDIGVRGTYQVQVTIQEESEVQDSTPPEDAEDVQEESTEE